jgi:hypothetical protein
MIVCQDWSASFGLVYVHVVPVYVTCSWSSDTCIGLLCEYVWCVSLHTIHFSMNPLYYACFGLCLILNIHTWTNLSVRVCVYLWTPSPFAHVRVYRVTCLCAHTCGFSSVGRINRERSTRHVGCYVSRTHDTFLNPMTLRGISGLPLKHTHAPHP